MNGFAPKFNQPLWIIILPSSTCMYSLYLLKRLHSSQWVSNELLGWNDFFYRAYNLWLNQSIENLNTVELTDSAYSCHKLLTQHYSMAYVTLLHITILFGAIALRVLHESALLCTICLSRFSSYGIEFSYAITMLHKPSIYALNLWHHPQALPAFECYMQCATYNM